MLENPLSYDRKQLQSYKNSEKEVISWCGEGKKSTILAADAEREEARFRNYHDSLSTIEDDEDDENDEDDESPNEEISKDNRRRTSFTCNNNPPELAYRVLEPLLHVLKQHHGADKVNRIVIAAARSVGITDPSSLLRSSVDELWVSIRFHNELRRLIFTELYHMEKLPSRDHPLWRLWHQAGLVAFQKEGLGSLVFPVVKALGSPGILYRNLPREMKRCNTVLKVEMIDASCPGLVEFSIRPHHPKSYKEGHEFCCNRIGCFEAIPSIWGFPKAQVEHTKCMHDPLNPADECRYIVRFEERRFVGILQSAFCVMVCVLGSVFFASKDPYFDVVSLSLIGLILALALEGWRHYLSIRRRYHKDRQHMRDLIELYDKRYMDLWKESEELRLLTLDNRNISAYVPPQLLRRLKGRREQIPRLGGTKREATIVFVDIRSYSTMSEHLDPEQTLQILNQCFSAWVKDVQSHGGTVLEFLGDGMLAVFGAPNDQPDHALQAVQCLKCMVGTMDRLNSSTNDDDSMDTRAPLLPQKLEIRAGIHTGTVIAGNLGSATQMKYAVVGDTVNVAARLEQLNKTLGTTIAVSGDTYSRLPPTLREWVQYRGRHFVKGREGTVDVYAYHDASNSDDANSAPPARRRLSLIY